MSFLKKAFSRKKKSKPSGDWEQELYHTLLKTGSIKHAALIDEDSNVKVANFAVDQDGVEMIMQVFKGNTSAMKKDGFRISEYLPVYIPGKLDKGKAIYTTAVPSGDGSFPGGCVILKSKKMVVVAAYEDDVAAATRLAREVVARIKELGY